MSKELESLMVSYVLLQNKLIDLQQRINKAIEYATKEMRIVNDNEYHRLLEILGGKE